MGKQDCLIMNIVGKPNFINYEHLAGNLITYIQLYKINLILKCIGNSWSSPAAPVLHQTTLFISQNLFHSLV